MVLTVTDSVTDSNSNKVLTGKQNQRSNRDSQYPIVWRNISGEEIQNKNSICEVNSVQKSSSYEACNSLLDPPLNASRHVRRTIHTKS